MGSHLIDGEFQSDKFPTCPRGKVPLSTKDPAAQDLIWTYAERRRVGSHGSREVDAQFADDVQEALRLKGYVRELFPMSLEPLVQQLKRQLGVPEGSGMVDGKWVDTGPLMGAIRRALSEAYIEGRAR